MSKVRLNPVELQVESFEIPDSANPQGTVDAQELVVTGVNGRTCQPMQTCYQGYSCPAFSCPSQCAHGCPNDDTELCPLDTAEGTCGYTCDIYPEYATCAFTCLQTCGCP